MSTDSTIVEAARRMEAAGKTTFTAEDLAVEAWKGNKELMGLRGYKELYPNNNKVVVALSGKHGLVAKVWLERVGANLFSVGSLAPGGLGETTSALSQANEQFLSDIITSDAFSKMQANKRGEVRFVDACDFWKVVEGMDPLAQIELVRKRILQLTGILERAGGELVMSNKRPVDQGTLREILNIHTWMKERFKAHLRLLSGRTH